MAAPQLAPIPKSYSRLSRSLLAIPVAGRAGCDPEDVRALADQLHLPQGAILLLITDHSSQWQKLCDRFRGDRHIQVMLAASAGEGACRMQAVFAAVTFGADFLLFLPAAALEAESVLKMADAITEADVVLAAARPERSSLQETWARQWLATLAGGPVRHPLADCQMWRVPLLRRLPFSLTAGSAYEFQTSLLFYALRAGARVAEISDGPALPVSACGLRGWLRSAWVPMKLAIDPWRGPQPSL